MAGAAPFLGAGFSTKNEESELLTAAFLARAAYTGAALTGGITFLGAGLSSEEESELLSLLAFLA